MRRPVFLFVAIEEASGNSSKYILNNRRAPCWARREPRKNSEETGGCQKSCKRGCQKSRKRSCQKSCKRGCQKSCKRSCQESCKRDCQKSRKGSCQKSRKGSCQKSRKRKLPKELQKGLPKEPQRKLPKRAAKSRRAGRNAKGRCQINSVMPYSLQKSHRSGISQRQGGNRRSLGKASNSANRA